MKKYRQVHGFYFEDGEEFLIERLLPECHIGHNIAKNNISVDYAARLLQNELNYLLNSFLNGGFSYKGYMLYPFAKDVSKHNIERVKRLKEAAVFLSSSGYDFSSSIGKYKGGISSKGFASIVSALYNDFSLIKNKDCTRVKKPECKELELSSYKKSDFEYLSPLGELKDYACSNLKGHLLGFYLHGSLATKDYVKGWSDVDTLGIVSKNTISNPEALLSLRDMLYRMRNFFYRIDPLQHHGIALISEYDLDSYCQAYFPTPIFRYAKSFFKQDKISRLKLRDFSNEALIKLFWFVNYFRKLNFEKRFDLGCYGTKTLLHSITLFPSLYLQANGTLAYKKFSFDIARKHFKKEHWKVVDEVSSIRYAWKDFGTIPLVGLFSRLNPLLCYQLNSRISDLFKDMKKANKIDAKKIIKGIFELSEDAWGKVKQDVKSKKL